jgi:hypothetical protein
MQVIEMRLRLIAARKGTPEAIQHTQHHSGQKFQSGAVRGNGGYGRAFLLHEAIFLPSCRGNIPPVTWWGTNACPRRTVRRRISSRTSMKWRIAIAGGKLAAFGEIPFCFSLRF